MLSPRLFSWECVHEQFSTESCWNPILCSCDILPLDGLYDTKAILSHCSVWVNCWGIYLACMDYRLGIIHTNRCLGNHVWGLIYGALVGTKACHVWLYINLKRLWSPYPFNELCSGRNCWLLATCFPSVYDATPWRAWSPMVRLCISQPADPAHTPPT